LRKALSRLAENASRSESLALFRFFFLSLPVAGCPNGGGFLVNGHDVDVRRNYSVVSTCHTGVDNAPEWELEHDIAKSQG
jgi:hypothetical protein